MSLRPPIVPKILHKGSNKKETVWLRGFSAKRQGARVFVDIVRQQCRGNVSQPNVGATIPVSWTTIFRRIKQSLRFSIDGGLVYFAMINEVYVTITVPLILSISRFYTNILTVKCLYLCLCFLA